MQIGLGARMIVGPPEGLLSILELISFHGAQGSNRHSRSSIEAEYKALVNATMEIMWV
jgi:hypothetical protein